jgi:hypothetical protein
MPLPFAGFNSLGSFSFSEAAKISLPFAEFNARGSFSEAAKMSLPLQNLIHWLLSQRR